MIRVLRVKATGQWCAPAIEDAKLPDDPGYADRVAAALGLQAGSLEVVDAEADPRTGELLQEPYTPPPPAPPSPAPAVLVAKEQERAAALNLLHNGTITKQQFEDVTGKPYVYGVNYPAPF